MLKCASVYTYEIDDHETAYQEIKKQLDEKLSLMENTAGIIMCHPEFILSGTLKYICDRLSFPLVGVTTASQAVNGQAGELILTIFVMTADDITFKSGVTEDLTDDVEGPTRTAYEKAAAGMTEEPKLVLAFPPLILKYAGDIYPNIWGKILPHTPNFGTIAIDDTVSFDSSETIYNGVNSRTCMSFVLCYGNIKPRFLVGSLPENNVMSYTGEVTKAEGPLVAEINNINAYKYFEERGFASNGAPTDSFLFVPFMIDLKKRADYDGIPVMRVLTSFTDDGTAIFRGNVDQDSIFTLSKCTREDVVSSTIAKMEEINNMPDVHGVLSFSCIIRRMVLGRDPLAELENAKNTLNLNVPFMMGYAGGEICPTSVKDCSPANRFHNYSLVTLII